MRAAVRIDAVILVKRFNPLSHNYLTSTAAAAISNQGPRSAFRRKGIRRKFARFHRGYARSIM